MAFPPTFRFVPKALLTSIAPPPPPPSSLLLPHLTFINHNLQSSQLKLTLLPNHHPLPLLRYYGSLRSHSYLVHSFIQTAEPLHPILLHPKFHFRGSIPGGTMQTREAYLAYRESVLHSFPDWINNTQEISWSTSRDADGVVKDVAIAKMLWSGTNTANDGILGEGWKAERRRVAYRGLIWLERRNDSEELSSVEAWGNLPTFRAQLEGKEEVTEAEWTEARTMKVDTTKGWYS